jgi:hypothetical protein
MKPAVLLLTTLCALVLAQNPDLVNLPDNTWKKMTPTFDPPGLDYSGFGHPHGESMLTFDENAGVAVWFGGCSYGYTNQTWVYSVTQNKWTMANDLTYEDADGVERELPMNYETKVCNSLPNGMCNYGITYDSDARLCIKHKGLNSGWTTHPGELNSNTTFSFNGSTFEWKRAARWDGSSFSDTYTFGAYPLAYDSRYKKTIMFGGSANTVCGFTACDLTYAFDYASGVWKRMNPAVKPPKVNHHNVAYLKSQEQTLALVNGQTWWYNYGTNTWTRKSDGPSVSKAAMCYDSNNDVVILFKSGNTWVYKPESDQWQQMNPSPSPSSNKVWQLAYDPVNNVAVVIEVSSTWVYRYKRTTTTVSGKGAANKQVGLCVVPNPFTGTARITLGAKCRIQVIAPDGRLVRQVKEATSMMLSGKNLAPGIYLVRAVAENRVFTKKVMLIR